MQEKQQNAGAKPFNVPHLNAKTKHLHVTISVGFATFPADAENKTELIERADRALYDAKENGRNQARHYSDSENFTHQPFRII